jgi:hypothetical protein
LTNLAQNAQKLAEMCAIRGVPFSRADFIPLTPAKLSKQNQPGDEHDHSL